MYRSTNVQSLNLFQSGEPVVTSVHLSPPHCPELVDNAYEFVYSYSMPTEVLILGIVSLILTVLNIICIIAMSIIVLKVCKCITLGLMCFEIKTIEKF